MAARPAWLPLLACPMPNAATAHIINHTHWDREWFLTSVYTSRWIPGLIERLDRRVAENPDYRYLFDGQTLVLEDLRALSEEHFLLARRLIGSGNLIVGPYYCQPDWKLTHGELLLRNLVYGLRDAAEHGEPPEAGWMVDTFGHISQSPQIHSLAGIHALYVWRGVPELVPYFYWQGTDGSRLLTINLFGGYRNLYGVSHAPEVALKRLRTEIDKLRPYYPNGDIPLFDGYDLEDDPEDPLRLFESLGGPGAAIAVRENTAAGFAREVAARVPGLPALHGELNSGKYGAVFPGTLTARTYLKVMAHDCEQLLLARCEPLAAMAVGRGREVHPSRYEGWSRLLLQNAVHDCICGVSIDQVHEKMEFGYREAFAGMLEDLEASLATLLFDFAPGTYAVSTNPAPHEAFLEADDQLHHVVTDGIGAWPVAESLPLRPEAGDAGPEPAAGLWWRNDHYEATVAPDGTVIAGEQVLGRLIVSEEAGDTYSEASGRQLAVLAPAAAPVVAARSAAHRDVAYAALWEDGERRVEARVRIRFDRSPLVQWRVDLDSRGANLRVDIEWLTRRAGRIAAGMPFDLVDRPARDKDLLPRDLPPTLASILLGQRELNQVDVFPFRDVVSVSDDAGSTAVMARGLRAYRASTDGNVRLPLRRSVEWLTAADLADRVGDAGPFFYVPDAREERTVRHEVAAAPAAPDPADPALRALVDNYLNPPLIVRIGPGAGTRRSWSLWRAPVPLASLRPDGAEMLARVFNPSNQPLPLPEATPETDLVGRITGMATAIAPRKIVTLRLQAGDGDVSASVPAPSSPAIDLLTPPMWRVGDNLGRPDPAILAELADKIAALAPRLDELTRQIEASQGADRMRLQHRFFVLKRESLELELSLLLNRRKQEQDGRLTRAYLYEPDAEIAELGLALNGLRIRRRIYDYVVQAL